MTIEMKSNCMDVSHMTRHTLVMEVQGDADLLLLPARALCTGALRLEAASSPSQVWGRTVHCRQA